MKILLLVNNTLCFNYGNHVLFHNALMAMGHNVYFGNLHTLEIVDSLITVDTVHYSNEIAADTQYTLEGGHVDLAFFDIAWLFDHPAPSSEKDLFFILWVAARKVRFVNDIANSFFLNNKIVLRSLLGEFAVSGTVVSNNYERLDELLSDRETWVVKPPAEGNGQDVYLIEPEDKNRPVILESMTGNRHVKCGTYDPIMVGYCSKYAVAQPFIKEAKENERRLLFAGGDLIGWYGTRKKENDHRANRIHGAEKYLIELNDEELEHGRRIGEVLRRYGINYCAADFAGESVLELNILTPGGAQVLSKLGDEGIVDKALQKIIESVSRDK